MTMPMKPKAIDQNNFHFDLAILFLVIAMFDLGKQVEDGEFKEDDLIVNGEPSEHDLKITNKIEGLKKRLIKTVIKNRKHEKKVKPIREMLLSKMIQCDSEVVQLDYLGLFILVQRFSTERTEKVHDRLKWIQNEEDDIISVLSLLDKTSISGIEKEMENIAEYIISL